MTKADLVDRIHSVTNRSKKDSYEILETVFSVLKDALASGEKIKIKGFGNFEVKQKRDRKGRNPHTGEPLTIEARRVLSFKISSVFKAAMNE